TNITTSQEAYQSDQQTSTFETPDGKEFTFLTKSFVDQQPGSTVKGTARLVDGGLKVSLTDPQERELDLSPAVFISTHLVDLIDAAREGEQLVKRDVFDGSDEADEVVASSAFIGEARAFPEVREGESKDAVAPLADMPAWPVTISYFDKGVGASAESLPVYEASFVLYENGISRKLTMRYPDYAMKGELTSLEMLESEPCTPAD
ncbi:MAG: DUF1849 family protein, partial [Pseudomonadota bacterium]|nr:DUF1849 family protein [Pseudomonadota bacterium]